ncbi:putative lipid-binding protein AIR1B [Andrographis paniculata]|uniref:putative lipid-binding protein AIR1B n=1 Tax=Andrographis paniculata TaxID=175694 RepID=UPI0021E760D0|nr:putative lipid-binding protein AIR1B [Andrographis paniculata]
MASKAALIFVLSNVLFFTMVASSSPTCNPLDLTVCAKVLNLLKLNIGTLPPKSDCCSLIPGVLDVDAALCLCASIKSLNVLNLLTLTQPLSLELIVNLCGCQLPPGFKCPA